MLRDEDRWTECPLQGSLFCSNFPWFSSNYYFSWYMIYLLTAIGLSPGGSSTIHIYTQTTHRTIRNKKYNTTILEECGPCPVLASYTPVFAIQPRKKQGKTPDLDKLHYIVQYYFPPPDDDDQLSKFALRVVSLILDYIVW